MSKSNLDMSLDEIAQKEGRVREEGDRRGGRVGRRGGRGGRRRDNEGVIRRTSGRSSRRDGNPYARMRGNPDKEEKWNHDAFEQLHGGSNVRVQKQIQNVPSFTWGTKVTISNLRYDVLEDDLRDLMEVIAPIESVKIFYDIAGRSEGRAEVVFRSKFDAEQAVKEYNGAEIDSQRMIIEVGGKVKIIGSRGDSWRDRGGFRGRSDRDDRWRSKDDRPRDDRDSWGSDDRQREVWREDRQRDIKTRDAKMRDDNQDKREDRRNDRSMQVDDNLRVSVSF